MGFTTLPLFGALFCFTTLFFTSVVRAQTLQLESGERRTQMVELYTSEGCSSCPPAEAFLNQYRQDPRLWRQVIPLAFHVDYWDYLGWRDPYDSAANSARQRLYARTLGMNTVYTPALFLNGVPWRNWRWGRMPATEVSTGKLSVSIDGSRLEASFQPLSPAAAKLQLHVALLGMGLETEIRAGENRGRHARHEFVVLAHQVMEGEGGHWRGELPGASLKASRYAVVAWVSETGRPAPVQAVGAYLP